MAFRFKRKESVEKGLRRVGQERITCALKEIQSGDKLEAVHRVRMEIKKLRAILRLVRKAGGESLHVRQTELLRNAADALGPVRDAHVTIKALRDLITHFKGQFPPQPFKQVKRELQARCHQATVDFAKQSSSKLVTKNLRTALREFRGLRLHPSGWDALYPGLSWSYKRGRCCKAACLKRPSPETLHEWRKRVKDLWYQVRLLRPIWPEQMCATASELRMLSDQLGGDHDLVMLKGVLEQIQTDQTELETLRGLIIQRQQELRSVALLLGARFYAEKPVVFVNRLGRYWSIWRAAKGKLKRKARASIGA
jgi:CHAD domain-containing protein